MHKESNALPQLKKSGGLAHLRSIDALTRFGIDLLQKERPAILTGAFDQLADLGDRKSELLDEIESRAEAVARDQTTSERHAKRTSLLGVASILSRRASENQNLLASAIGGAKKASEMIERLNTGGASGFYGASGRKIATASQSVQPVMKV